MLLDSSPLSWLSSLCWIRAVGTGFVRSLCLVGIQVTRFLLLVAPSLDLLVVMLQVFLLAILLLLLSLGLRFLLSLWA